MCGVRAGDARGRAAAGAMGEAKECFGKLIQQHRRIFLLMLFSPPLEEKLGEIWFKLHRGQSRRLAGYTA